MSALLPWALPLLHPTRKAKCQTWQVCPTHAASVFSLAVSVPIKNMLHVSSCCSCSQLPSQHPIPGHALIMTSTNNQSLLAPLHWQQHELTWLHMPPCKMQVTRPDRLTAAMSTLVCNAIGLTSLSPPPLNLAKMLSEQTTAGKADAYTTLLQPSPTTTKLLKQRNSMPYQPGSLGVPARFQL